ncbi:MAG: KH domain-containing protein [Clostridia bacterium]|jgi:predicted RNA-binding protein YlqC (UPF0109 family)|nr:KH domain-containing protein [Clostridia bacterium]
MKEILEIMIKSLVEDVEAVEVTQKEKEKTITYSVKVSQKDMGKVIGKQGKIAKSIRTVVKAIAAKENKKINIEFVE